MNLAEYCRELEAHLCRKNDGHLIRIVGPSFDCVARWAAQGVPLKVSMAGIDRYFERYYRKGPRRRPVRIDFCEADVLDMFDEWRRATGITPEPQAAAENRTGDNGRKRGPSLHGHLERVLLRLSSLRATGVLSELSDSLIDRVSAEFDGVRNHASVRGEARKEITKRLDQLDRELVELAMQTADVSIVDAARREATDELAPFRETMPAAAYRDAVERATAKALRDQLRLPVVSFS
jgi:hypothetical protein